jgi:[acyl-carrier-protein] S-malonyltransferase
MNKLAYLFPGQGSQYIGMGQDLFERYDEVKSLYRAASTILGYDLAEVSFNGPEEKLKETIVTQPAILLQSLSWLTVLRGAEVRPDYAAGHSLGEYSALTAAGFVTPEHAIRAVDTRCKAMQEACAQQRGTMAAIIGMNQGGIETLIERVKSEGVCVPANFNSPDQVAISGDFETVEKALVVAKELGAKRAMLLPVGGAFHSPLMQSAATRLQRTLDELSFSEPKFPIIANVTAQVETDPARVKQLLVSQITAPVQWVATLEELYRLGVRRFVEVGPGKVLSGLVKRTLKDVEIMSLDKLPDFDLVAEKLMEVV